MLYEDAIAVGGSIGAIISVYHPTIPYGSWLVPLAGLFGGIFVGCWAMALTEMLDLFPIFIRRIRLVRGIGAIIKIFTIAGPVILYGIFTSWVLGLFYWLLRIVGVL